MGAQWSGAGGNADMQLLTLLDAPAQRRIAYAELLPALLECTPATSQWGAERTILNDMERACTVLIFCILFSNSP